MNITIKVVIQPKERAKRTSW